MPWSARDSRDFTESLATIWLTVKCFPTSRRNSKSDMGRSQSALLTSRARPDPSSPVEVEELLELAPDALEVGLQRLLAQERPLLGLAPRVADEPGPPAGHGDGPVPGQLQPAQIADLQQMAHVQAVGGRIEAAVGGQLIGVQPLLELGVGQLVDQSPEPEVLGELGHGLSLPRRRSGVVPHRHPGHAATRHDRPPTGVTDPPASSRHADRYARTPSTTNPTPAEDRPMPNPYLQGNFAPVLEERSDDVELPVTGVIPPDLEGRLLRNGPNPAVIPADEADYHWFSGDGMVHAISLAGGRATGYRNRWVRTRALSAKTGTPPPRGPGEPIDGPANTHVIRHAGTTLALIESGFPHALSSDLRRARVHDFDGALASPMTAHPKVDPVSGELVFFGTDVFGPPFLRYHVADTTGCARPHRGDRDPPGHDDARLRGDRHPGGLPRPSGGLRPRAGRRPAGPSPTGGCPRPGPGSV